MVNQQKGVQQDTAYSGVVVKDHMYPYIIFSMTPLGQKRYRDGDTIHYNSTIGSILLDSFLLIYHPYPLHFMK